MRGREDQDAFVEEKQYKENSKKRRAVASPSCT